MARTLLDDTIVGARRRPRRRDAPRAGVQGGGGRSRDRRPRTAMRVCGGAAFRKDVGVERYFRDAHAAGVMGPTTDVLYDFIGKAVCGHAALLKDRSMTITAQGIATA